MVANNAHLAATRSKWTPPPLMKLSMWKRASGRFAVMQIIACVNSAALPHGTSWYSLPVVLPKLFPALSYPDHDSNAAHVHHWHHMQCYRRAHHRPYRLCGTLLKSFANVFFALIKPAAPYWAFGFPAAVLSVFGADFVFAAGTLFIAKISLPHEQSVAGALFQTMTQLGTAFGLSVTTIVFNRAFARESLNRGDIRERGWHQRTATCAAQGLSGPERTAFAFGILGVILSFFLKEVGVVGHDAKGDGPKDRHTVKAEKTATS
ncbi:hypothetical protein EW146_g9190 [Bondarzewia mesenterica]|uniref:Major facilitator superfamily (MFS) profile domain-containing protein n=1 Tax=Bondarzewia mesenterica TaxID=1095465 RepID=A0A4S4L8S9_9AGAM|nr:hypothetical protein EW146_g9190 [Bondarzewia mesenterica]